MKWVFSPHEVFPPVEWRVTSVRYAKSEQELQAYEMPITKIIEQNAIKDIEDIDP